MNYEGKFGTQDNQDTDRLNDLFLNSETPKLDELEQDIEMPTLHIDIDEVNTEARRQAKIITERLSNYFFDQKYIDEHPYIPAKIATEMDNIRRLLKMLAVNEKAQDTLILTITSIGLNKGTLYSSLTSLQNSMLNIQSQLNSLTSSLEAIFIEMQNNCEKTFTEKDKENNEDGSIIVRGSREFIKNIDNYINGDSSSLSDLDETTTNDIVTEDNLY